MLVQLITKLFDLGSSILDIIIWFAGIIMVILFIVFASLFTWMVWDMLHWNWS